LEKPLQGVPKRIFKSTERDTARKMIETHLLVTARSGMKQLSSIYSFKTHQGRKAARKLKVTKTISS